VTINGLALNAAAIRDESLIRITALEAAELGGIGGLQEGRTGSRAHPTSRAPENLADWEALLFICPP